MAEPEHELRCSCQSGRLLGMVLRDSNGKPYLQIRSHRQRRTITEIHLESGSARIWCASCGRWSRIWVRSSGVEADSPGN